MTIGVVFDRAVTLLVHRWRAAAAIAVLASLPAALSQLAILEDERAFALRERRRTALLAYASTMTYVIPVLVIGVAIEAVGHGLDVWWPVVALPPLQYALGVTFYAAVLAVAAQDYAARREGRDLEGVLDGLESA